jgi:hypothetical protein
MVSGMSFIVCTVAARAPRGIEMEGAGKSLGRMAAHLPNMTMNDPLARITVDDRGRVWVTEDTTLVILKVHLVIEAELIDICGRCLKSPEALEASRVSFGLRLNLVRALVGNDAMPEIFWQAINDINRIRNKLAHNLEPHGIDGELEQFFRRFGEIDDFRSLLRDVKSLPQRLITCLCFLTGALSGIGGLRRKMRTRSPNDPAARSDPLAGACAGNRRRRARLDAPPRILRGQHPQSAHAPSLCAHRAGISALVRDCRRALDRRGAAQLSGDRDHGLS